MNVQKLVWAGLLAFSLAPVAIAQDASPQSDQGAKSDIKDAGRDTKRAVKKTGHKVKKGTKKAAHKTAQKTRQGAEKVEDKTTNNPPQR